MKIRIELEDNIVEDEIIIKCRQVDDTIKKMQDAILDITSSTQKLSFFKEDAEYYLSLDEILFFETSESSIYAHTASDVYKVKYKLYELEEFLPRNFLRVSKSTILNINHILSISHNITSSSLVQLNNTHKQVFVSRYYYKDLRKRLDDIRQFNVGIK